MKWLEKLRWVPSKEARAGLHAVQERAEETRTEVVQAYVQQLAVERQAQILKSMDSSNHYSESLTQAMRGRT